MGHGFAGTRDVALPFFAQRFAASGLAALVIDYRHFGASGGAPRQLIDPWRQLEDWRSALAHVRGRSDVDGGRVALWGSSLGGGLALVTAADDQNIRAVVAQAPQIDSDLEGEASFPGVWWAIQLLFTGWWDLISTSFGGDAVTMPAIAPADEWGMLADDAAYTAFEKLVADGSTYRNEVVAHSVFTFDDYNPAARSEEIGAPVLLIASRKDRFAPYAGVEAFAARAKSVEVVEFDGDHFDVYSPPAAELAAGAAADFLSRHLGTPAPQAP
jgi:pimeloyl-ACP methyl ester carboxylesterase